MKEKQIVSCERALFYMYCDVEKYVDGTKFMFADELAEYTFVPYVGKLKNIPGYRENKNSFEDARIYLLGADNTSVRMVPCNVLEEQKRIYISDGSFNRYWKRISESLRKGVKRLSEENLRHEDMNRRVDLSYVKTLYREAEIREDFTLFCNEQISSTEMQCLVGKSVTVDAKHDSYYKQDCEKEDLIQAGAQDYKKHEERYIELFQKVPVKRLYELFIVKQACCYWTHNELYIICDEDHWRIVKKHGKLCLLHNSYLTSLGGERIFAQSWHKEKARTVNQALRTICAYNYQQHRRWREQRLLQEGVIGGYLNIGNNWQ